MKFTAIEEHYSALPVYRSRSSISENIIESAAEMGRYVTAINY